MGNQPRYQISKVIIRTGNNLSICLWEIKLTCLLLTTNKFCLLLTTGRCLWASRERRHKYLFNLLAVICPQGPACCFCTVYTVQLENWKLGASGIFQKGDGTGGGWAKRRIILLVGLTDRRFIERMCSHSTFTTLCRRSSEPFSGCRQSLGHTNALRLERHSHFSDSRQNNLRKTYINGMKD